MQLLNFEPPGLPAFLVVPDAELGVAITMDLAVGNNIDHVLQDMHQVLREAFRCPH